MNFYIKESEVLSATGTGAQVSSWAGWAVGAVTSKFYKSNISQQQINQSQKQQEKSSSIERNASTSSSGDVSSISTTRSSVASEGSKNPSRCDMRDDDSDYDDTWNNSNWDDQKVR